MTVPKWKIAKAWEAYAHMCPRCHAAPKKDCWYGQRRDSKRMHRERYIAAAKAQR